MATRQSESGYYGIPKKTYNDGLDDNGQLCVVEKQKQNKKCTPMTRQYYLQYQWMPFYLATLAMLYYLPYMLFRVVNNDLGMLFVIC